LLAGPTVEIADAGLGTNSTSTQGACNIYNGAVTYTLTWTAVGGAPGQFVVQCVWALWGKTCTPTHARGTLVSGLINSL